MNFRNEEWLESAVDNFDEAVSQRNWAQADAVVHDIADAGFTTAAMKLAKELSDKKHRLSFDVVGSQMDAIFKGIRV